MSEVIKIMKEECSITWCNDKTDDNCAFGKCKDHCKEDDGCEDNGW